MNLKTGMGGRVGISQSGSVTPATPAVAAVVAAIVALLCVAMVAGCGNRQDTALAESAAIGSVASDNSGTSDNSGASAVVAPASGAAVAAPASEMTTAPAPAASSAVAVVDSGSSAEGAAQPDESAAVSSEEAGRRLKLVNAVVAAVNDEIITREDLLRDLRPQMAEWQQTLPSREFQLRVKQEMHERLRTQVRQKLLAQDAERHAGEEMEKPLAKRIEQDRQKAIAAAGSVEAWREKLAERRLTEESWLREQRLHYLVMTLIATEFSPRVSVTRQELLDYYNQSRDEHYTQQDKARPQIIKLLLKDHGGMDDMLAKARSIISRARGGEDFQKLAEQFTADGSTDWDFVGRDSFREKAINEALFELPVGAVSDPIVTDDCVYIVRVAERVDGRVIPFTEVQGEIEQAVRQFKLDLMINEHLTRLQERSYIRIYEENL